MARRPLWWAVGRHRFWRSHPQLEPSPQP